MLHSEFINFFEKLKGTVGPEDISERMNFVWTPLLLLLCTASVVAKQYVSDPIQCFFTQPPGTAVPPFMAFANSYCYVSGTYAYNHKGPNFDFDTERHMLQNYYQWVPFVLGVQFLLSFLPRVAWHSMSHRLLGSDLYALTQLAAKAKTEGRKKFSETAVQVSEVVQRMLEHSRDYREHGRMQKLRTRLHRCCPLMVFSKRMGTSVTLLYLAMKFICFGSAFGQLALIEAFLGFQADGHFVQFGFRMLDHVWNGTSWEESHIFPLRSLCTIRLLSRTSNRNDHIGQCTLSVNYLNAKIYIFLFFWFAAVAAVTLFCTFVWVLRLVNSDSSRQLVHVSIRSDPRVKDKLSKVTGCEVKATKADLKAAVAAFTKDYLRLDGLFVVLMLCRGSDFVMTSEVVRLLFRDWAEQNYRRDTVLQLLDLPINAADRQVPRLGGCFDEQKPLIARSNDSFSHEV